MDSSEILDIGTRDFILFFPKYLGSVQVADLGLGNGILGIICALNKLIILYYNCFS